MEAMMEIMGGTQETIGSAEKVTPWNKKWRQNRRFRGSPPPANL
jgi:hypothetical protein